MEPEEAKRAEPVTPGSAGQISGYGWYSEPHLTVRTNNRDDLANIPEELAEYGDSPVTKMDNFALAFGIVGKLVENGHIKINFDDYPDWHETIKLSVDSILEVMNRH
jgi:hypothetical protein